MLDRGRAAETISDLADHAVTLARGAGSAALPTVQRGAEGLSQVLQSAAGTLAETAEHLAGDSRVTAAGNAARERIADASDKLSTAIRPKKQTHRVRNLLIGAAVVGGVFALIQSPLRTKIQERLFGPAPSDDDELPQITLPDDDRHVEITDLTQASPAEPDAAADVVGTPVVAEPAPRGSRSQGHNHDEPVDNQETNA
ncbi:MAG TPA: hypothetical protein VND54_07455 [Candidatus Saccharimonadales bacterium]|nr:hypothetical protein [Candidatus Saccharimonadales bacterium]